MNTYSPSTTRKDGPHRYAAQYSLLPLRLLVGYGFLAHGLAKWSKGPAAFANILHAAGVPAAHLMSWLTIGTEILGGLCILLGAFVSLVSIPAIILLAVAIVTVHLPYGFSSIKLTGIVNGRAQFGPPGYECDLLYIVCFLALALSAPTPWSFDSYHALRRRRVE
ncbi:DoxX family protein [Acidicapsa dinghuensis]|uniref:DoxX family protein n=1 Tax=Acidicapsa dinghuensis TaxID=2218256 RepID=A0ABW1EDY8_9BACT|nr:DoxX family protein [Acidicapsa dinghuensis]